MNDVDGWKCLLSRLDKYDIILVDKLISLFDTASGVDASSVEQLRAFVTKGGALVVTHAQPGLTFDTKQRHAPPASRWINALYP